MTNIKSKSMSLSANCPSLEEAWVWAKELSEKFDMPVNNFSAYKYTQKFNKKTQKYEEMAPYYSCSVSLKGKEEEMEDVDAVI